MYVCYWYIYSCYTATFAAAFVFIHLHTHDAMHLSTNKKTFVTDIKGRREKRCGIPIYLFNVFLMEWGKETEASNEKIIMNDWNQ